MEDLAWDLYIFLGTERDELVPTHVNANTSLHTEGCRPTWKGEARPAEEARRSGLYPHLCSSRHVVNSEGSEKISTSHIHLKITFTLPTGIKGIQWFFRFFSVFFWGFAVTVFMCVHFS